MPNYLKPQSPLQNKEDYIYPLTTSDQIIINNKRLTDYSVISNNEVTALLTKSGWVEVDGQFEQTIVIDNLTEDYNVEVKVAYTGDCDIDSSISKNTSCIKYAKQDVDKITFYCLENKPNIDIPIELEVTV